MMKKWLTSQNKKTKDSGGEGSSSSFPNLNPLEEEDGKKKIGAYEENSPKSSEIHASKKTHQTTYRGNTTILSSSSEDEEPPEQMEEPDGEDGFSTSEEKRTTGTKTSAGKIKKTYKKKFMSDWLNLPEFKEWLLKGVKEDEAFCQLCNVKMKAGKSELKKHGQGKSHQKNLANKVTKNQPQLEQFTSLNMKIANTEAAICSYIVENNHPISSVEPLVEFIKSLPEKNVIEKIALGKQKATNMIRTGLRPFFNEDLCGKLKDHFFSVYIDETTDVSVKKQLAVLVTFLDDFKLKVDVVDLIDCPDGSADSLYHSLIRVLEQNNIPLENWVGFCSDTTNVMMGQHNSVSQKIKTDYPNVFISKCACHMIHLVASYACTKLSHSLEDLCRNIFNHFGRSPKNAAAFKEFQTFYEVKPHKILKNCQTRWLSLHDCVKRILEQWVPLQQYWMVLNLEDPTHSNKHTLQVLENPLMKCLMYFVEYALSLFNDFNCFFQSDYPQFCELKSKTEELIKLLALNFMTKDYVTKTSPLKIDPTLHKYHVEIHQVYLGIDGTEILQSTENKQETEVVKIRTSAKEFYIEAVQQIKKRFVFEEVHDDAMIVNPRNAMNLSPSSLVSIARRHIPNLVENKKINLTELDKEWRKQSICEEFHQDTSITPVEFWKNVSRKKDGNGSPEYKHLPVLIQYFFSLPFSNAATERLFSQVKNIKTDKRNRLDNETLSSILCVKYGLNRKGISSKDIVKNNIKIPTLRNVKASATASEAKEARLTK